MSGSVLPLGTQYPGDANLASDPDVFFVETAESSTLTARFARWNDNSTANSVAIDLTMWNCLEMLWIANNPVSGFDGEIALWINGVKVAHVKPGTLGSWDEDNFHPATTGTPFEGFQWRNSAALRANYLELLHFVDNDPAGRVNSVNYDHVVVARRYIGPLH